MTTIVPDSSKGGGNTKPPPKQISPAVRWCFTFNNYSEKDLCELVPRIDDLAKRGLIGKEVGKSGTPHLQGYVEFKKKMRPKSSFNERIHWEKAKGCAKSNHDYCSKDGNVIWRKGYPPKWAMKPIKVLDRGQLYPWQKQICEAIEVEPDDRTIWWFWSKKGNLGKTTFAKYLCMRHDATVLAGKGADVRNGVCEYVKRNGFTPHLVVYPIPRSYNADYLSYESIENIKDMLFYSGKFEGGMVCGNCPHVVIFANIPPQTEKMSGDRWKVFEIHDDNTHTVWEPKVLQDMNPGKKWIEVNDD